MARNTAVQLLDDLTGEPAAETVGFALDGIDYDIDLSSANAEALRELLGKYADAARRTGGRKQRPRMVPGAKKARAKAAPAPRAAKPVAGRRAAATTKAAAPKSRTAKATTAKATTAKAAPAKAAAAAKSAPAKAAPARGRAKATATAPVKKTTAKAAAPKAAAAKKAEPAKAATTTRTRKTAAAAEPKKTTRATARKAPAVTFSAPEYPPTRPSTPVKATLRETKSLNVAFTDLRAAWSSLRHPVVA